MHVTYHSLLVFEDSNVKTMMSYGDEVVEILGMLSLYHSFLISFSVKILGMFRY